MKKERKRVHTGAPWEPLFGYCRAIRVGEIVEVSGTTAMKDGEVFAEGDAYGQTRYILEIIKEALAGLGATMEEVVRTRIYVTDISVGDEVGKAHGESFGAIRPACSMVEVKSLIKPGLLVEIEAHAITDR